MARQSTTQLQVSADRFLAHRMEAALRCGQPAGGPAPGRAGLGLGCLLSAVVLAGAVVMAVLRPQPGLGDAPIVLDRATGALYVRVGDTVHPVFNLASARLIAGQEGPSDPRPVAGTAIGRARRGPPLGIPGAPGVLGPALAEAATWSLCDDPAGTTLVAGADPPQPVGIDPQEAVPVSSGSGATYLLLRGRRIPVNPADPALQMPRRLSALLLNAIPEVPASTLPDLDGRLTGLSAAVTLCVNWRAGDPAGITLSVGAGPPLPAGAEPTVLAQADGPGPALDGVYLPPGRSAYVRAAGVSGRAGGAGYLIAETGVRFTVGDDAAARSLGLPSVAGGVPWPMLAGLPAGPLLSREQALLARDVVAGP